MVPIDLDGKCVNILKRINTRDILIWIPNILNGKKSQEPPRNLI